MGQKNLFLVILLLISIVSANGLVYKVLVGAEPPADDDNSIPAWQFMKFYPASITINVGDQILFVANDHEFHAVAFHVDNETTHNENHAPDLFVFNAELGMPVYNHLMYAIGDGTFDGSSTISSGQLCLHPQMCLFREWLVTFTAVGSFHYHCPVHAVTMWGAVHVQDANLERPKTPEQVDAEAAQEVKDDLAKISGFVSAHNMDDDVETVGAAQQDGSVHFTIHSGFGDVESGANYNRFWPRSHFTVNVGDTVIFTTKTSTHIPHTATFNSSGEFTPFQIHFNDTLWAVNPFYLAPALPEGNNYSMGFANSGIMLPVIGSFNVTFTSPGIYPYRCVLHEMLGMVGEVTVVDQESASSVNTPAFGLVLSVLVLLALNLFKL